MPKRSAGLMLYRRRQNEVEVLLVEVLLVEVLLVEVLLVHPGGPYWRGKDEGAWSIPKGLCEEGEDALMAAKREFEEETGHRPSGELVALGEFRQPGGKLVLAYASEGDFDPASLRSNLFSIEWPPRSGKMMDFPEIDRGGWFAPDEARRKLLRGQVPILDALLRRMRA